MKEEKGDNYNGRRRGVTMAELTMRKTRWWRSSMRKMRGRRTRTEDGEVEDEEEQHEKNEAGKEKGEQR